MYVLKTAGFYFSLIYATWLFFLAIMALKSARDNGKLTKASEVMATPILIVGWCLDFSLNMCATPVFLDLPREWLLTIRCDRYLSIPNPTGLNAYRQKFARLLCQNLLDPFQSGGHCRGINP
ncbi:MAG: hypothetical protein KGL39_41960 [Patescibacteria group bacterium]|nr:hypothetical protein [Patescibacteria group bacterium]